MFKHEMYWATARAVAAPRLKSPPPINLYRRRISNSRTGDGSPKGWCKNFAKQVTRAGWTMTIPRGR